MNIPNFEVSPVFFSILKLSWHFDSLSKTYGCQTSTRNGQANILYRDSPLTLDGMPKTKSINIKLWQNIFHFQLQYFATEKWKCEFYLKNEKIVVIHSGAKIEKQKRFWFVGMIDRKQISSEWKELVDAGTKNWMHKICFNIY